MKQLNNKEARQLSGGTDIITEARWLLSATFPLLTFLRPGADQTDLHIDPDDK